MLSRRLIGEAEHFWQKRYYDCNVRDDRKFMEKLRYIHRNPVKRGLCERPEDWEGSSFRHYVCVNHKCRVPHSSRILA
jgi:putative transposase